MQMIWRYRAVLPALLSFQVLLEFACAQGPNENVFTKVLSGQVPDLSQKPKISLREQFKALEIFSDLKDDQG